MTREQAEREMTEGYIDGFNRNSPEPSGNRSLSYLHGFASGRDDLHSKPRDWAETLRIRAEECIRADVNEC